MRRLVMGLVLAIGWLSPATAQAGIYDQVLHVYQARGSIPPCQFTSAQLSNALKGIDTYGQQYFADFTNAVQSALAQRAGGACLPGANQATAGTATLPPLRPGSLTAPTNSGLPAPILAMAALGLAIALALGVTAGARSAGWEPEWLDRWRHACAEATYRVGGGFGHFADWWRWGR